MAQVENSHLAHKAKPVSRSSRTRTGDVGQTNPESSSVRMRSDIVRPTKPESKSVGTRRSRKHKRAEREQRRPRRGSRLRSRAPTYALTVVGKILYTRLQRNAIFTSGASLVRQISSCSLLGWRDRILSAGTPASVTGGTSTVSCQTNTDNFHDNQVSGCSSVSDCGNHTGSSSDINSNVNARTVASVPDNTSRPVDHKVTRRLKSSTPQHSRRAPRRGIAARNVLGKSRLRERRRHGLRGQQSSAALRRSKVTSSDHLANTSLIASFNCGRKKGQHRPATTHSERTSPNTASVDETRPDNGPRQQVLHNRISPTPKSETGRKKVQASSADSCVGTRGSATPKAERAAKRKARKWRQLVGVASSAPLPVARKSKRKRGETTDRRDEVETQPTPDPASDWPCLPGRAKTAREIVMSKLSASVNKMTRRRWADIVRRDGRDGKDVGEDSAVQAASWAAVAAGNTPEEKARLATDHSSTVREESVATTTISSQKVAESYQAPSTKKKRRKREFALAHTDRIWLTCQTARTRPRLESLYHQRHERKQSERSTCLVDTMTVVYSQQPVKVLSLAAPGSCDVNKCNNKGRPVGSGSDLCSQLGSMTFQGKQKKVSQSYRALMRDDKTGTRAGKPQSYRALMRDDKTGTRAGKRVGRGEALGAGRTDRQTTGRVDRQMVGRVERQTIGRTNRQTTRKTEGQSSGWIERTNSGRVERQSSGKLDRQMSARLDRPGTSRCRPRRVAQSISDRSATKPEDEHGERKQANTSDRLTRASASSQLNLDLETGPTTAAPPVKSQCQGRAVSSSSSANSDVIWRIDKNNSMFKLPIVSPSAAEVHRPPRRGPVVASSAPQLAERSSSLRVDLNPNNLNTLDMKWWSAYLHQTQDN